MDNFKGKTAFVTGGASGIGRAMEEAPSRTSMRYAVTSYGPCPSPRCPAPQMRVGESTDQDTPLAIERCSAGFRLPLLAKGGPRVLGALPRGAARSAPRHSGAVEQGRRQGGAGAAR